MPLTLCSNDNTFGPGAQCRNLDFTLTFQSIILYLVPDALFIIYALFRLSILYPYSSKLSNPGWLLLIPKIIITLLVVSANSAIVAFQGQTFNDRLSTVVFVSAPVSLLASVIIFEHFKTLSPSTLVITYGTLIRGLFGSVALRTGKQTGLLIQRPSLFIVMAISTTSYFALGLVELFEKRGYLKDRYKKYPIQSTSSFLSRALFIGFVPLLWSGRKTQLTYEDLTDIPEDQKVVFARQRLQTALETTSPGRAFLFRATMKAFGAPLFLPVLPRICLMLAILAQPLLVNSMVSFISSAAPISRGWALVGGYVCVYGTIPISTALYWQKVYAVTVQYRAALVGCIFQKALRLGYHEAAAVGTGAASTYMSVDVERICQGLEYTHELWASLLSIIFAIAILYSQAGWTAFLPVGVLILILGLTTVIGGNVGKQQAEWLKATDKRIKLISSVIKHFMPMKWASYEPYMERDISILREIEVDAGKAFCNLAIVLSALSNVASPLCMTVTLATYAVLAAQGHFKGVLDATRIFSIASTIFLLSAPVNFLGQQLPSILAAYASLRRIQRFLQLEDKDRQDAIDQPVSSSEDLIFEGSFSWSKEAEPALHDIKIQLPYNSLTMCIGPVASGKSTLLMSILGETLPNMRIQVSGGIAYASQDAFIFPGTVRENILCG
ncbi:hypothetical protein M422DRAFT_158793, partial [Sphaerobolus stellatus SS14]